MSPSQRQAESMVMLHLDSSTLCCLLWENCWLLPQGIMGKFQKNMAMVNNRGVDVVLNKAEEPLVKLKKRSKPLKVRQAQLAADLSL